MQIETAVNKDFNSNAFLVIDEPGGHGVLIDSGAPSEPVLAKIKELDVTVEHLLVTHHHWDHVMGNGEFKEQLGVEILAHPFEAAELRKYPELTDADSTIEGGTEIDIGGLHVKALHTPGHTAGMLAYVINDEAVFTGDTLFRGSVGGVKVLGSTNFADLRHSIMNVLMPLPPAVQVLSGHADPSTIGSEWNNNPFIRVWRGLDPEGTEHCLVRDVPATLVVWAHDYDGGYKAWVRWEESGEDDILPGSMIERG